MPRPIIRRRISEMPSITCFMPSDDVEGGTPENVLKLEELEALRLKDLDGLDQRDCAARMAISRPTFQRILLSAREKVADSLLHGKAIRIEGGVYVHIEQGRGYCRRCGRSWELPVVAEDGTGGGDAAVSAAGGVPGGPVVAAGITGDGQLVHSTNPALCPECASERMGRGPGGGRGQGGGRGMGGGRGVGGGTGEGPGSGRGPGGGAGGGPGGGRGMGRGGQRP